MVLKMKKNTVGVLNPKLMLAVCLLMIGVFLGACSKEDNWKPENRNSLKAVLARLTPEQEFVRPFLIAGWGTLEEVTKAFSTASWQAELALDTELYYSSETFDGPADILPLLDVGMNNTKRERLLRPAWYFAISHNNPDVVQFLIDEEDLKLWSFGKNGSNALMLACGNPGPKIVEMLLAIGVDVNAKNDIGFCALMAASFHSNVEAAQALISAGADPELASNDGQTVLMYACKNSTSDLVRLILDAGADKNVRDIDGKSLLMLAGLNPNHQVLELLLDSGADINFKSQKGGDALMWATLNPSEKAVKVLINAGANIDAVDNNGWTSLMVASRYSKNPAVVRALLKAGSYIRLKNNDGDSAGDLAELNDTISNTSLHNDLIIKVWLDEIFVSMANTIGSISSVDKLLDKIECNSKCVRLEEGRFYTFGPKGEVNVIVKGKTNRATSALFTFDSSVNTRVIKEACGGRMSVNVMADGSGTSVLIEE